MPLPIEHPHPPPLLSTFAILRFWKKIHFIDPQSNNHLQKMKKIKKRQFWADALKSTKIWESIISSDLRFVSNILSSPTIICADNQEASYKECHYRQLPLDSILCWDHLFLSLDFHELWQSVMSASLFTEVKQQWATLVLGWVTTSVHYSSLWWLCASGW